jgi:hypothetical protein
MRVTRRFSHYQQGEMIAVPFDAARDLDARRLAQPVQLFVPTPPGDTPEPEQRRQPAGVVRK